MRKIIFLDFDGVLHPDGIGKFSQLPIFERFLTAMPEAEVVVSSTWREDHTLDELRGFFSPPLQNRISGVTPSLEDGYELGGRQKEIQSYLTAKGLSDNNCAWVAVDDIAMFFEDSCPNLVLTDSSKGFTEQEGEQLVAWYSTWTRVSNVAWVRPQTAPGNVRNELTTPGALRLPGLHNPKQAPTTTETPMQRVTGIGGIFFKASDPKALGAWYRDHLGLDVADWGGAVFQWGGADSAPGMTLWSLFPADSDHMAPSSAPFMVNFRVADLDSLLAALRAEGCNVLDKTDASEHGKFGWVIDPEGNKVELWQPPEGQ